MPVDRHRGVSRTNPAAFAGLQWLCMTKWRGGEEIVLVCRRACSTCCNAAGWCCPQHPILTLVACVTEL
jgi:hypothetical protein